MPAWIVDLVEKRCEINSLLVPAYLDLDSPYRVVLFPQSVFLGSGSKFIYFGIDEATGQLRLGESIEASLPSELTGEPSIRPVFVDLTANYLGDGPPAKLKSITFYSDEASIPEEGSFRGVVLEFEGGEGIALDPFSFSGIRIGTVPDFRVAMSALSDIGTARICPRS